MNRSKGTSTECIVDVDFVVTATQRCSTTNLRLDVPLFSLSVCFLLASLLPLPLGSVADNIHGKPICVDDCIQLESVWDRPTGETISGVEGEILREEFPAVWVK